MINYSDLNQMQLDVLREISNIGAGNAATALSTLLGKKVDMLVPHASLAHFAQVPELIGGAEKEVAGGYLLVDEEMPMGILFLVPKEQMSFFFKILLGTELHPKSMLDDMQQSAFAEIVNILSGAYLNAISMFTQRTYSQSVPALCVDMAGAILGEVLMMIGEVSDYALIIENTFIADEDQLNGYFFLLPQPETLQKLFEALGVF
jgi:chemotaxis protein CheC